MIAPPCSLAVVRDWSYRLSGVQLDVALSFDGELKVLLFGISV